jgi:Ring finger domain
MLAIIIFGYIYFAIFTVIATSLACLVCALGLCKRDNLQDSILIKKVPFAKAVVSGVMKRRASTNTLEKHLECIICMEMYKQDDEITELKCNPMHQFHSKCIEDWFKKKSECPLCKIVIQI